MPDSPVRIASGQGFWGDWQEAPKLQVRRGPIDYLMLDYLAEITMSIMQKQKERDPTAGYARDFVPLIADLAADLARGGVRVISNAGGVNPRACSEAVIAALRERGSETPRRVAVVRGDDLMERLDVLLDQGHELRNMETGEPLASVREQVQSANAYLGAGPIVEALGRDAEIVITGRSTDTALTYAPMIHEFDWAPDDWNHMAAGVVAGHINECGAQAAGGNTLHEWREVDMVEPGYPIIEAERDGTFVVTKHAGLGGRVTWATVTEQLVYEMGDPTCYITPDVIADFSTIQLEDLGDDRVRIHGVRGRERTDQLKVSIAFRAGYKAVGELTYAWPDAVEKARRADAVLRGRLDRLGLGFDEIRTEYIGAGACHGRLAGSPSADLPEVQLRIGVRAAERPAVERFTRELAPLILAGPPTVTGFAGGRPRVQEVMAYWPALIDRDVVERDAPVATHGAVPGAAAKRRWFPGPGQSGARRSRDTRGRRPGSDEGAAPPHRDRPFGRQGGHGEHRPHRPGARDVPRSRTRGDCRPRQATLRGHLSGRGGAVRASQPAGAQLPASRISGRRRHRVSHARRAGKDVRHRPASHGDRGAGRAGRVAPLRHLMAGRAGRVAPLRHLNPASRSSRPPKGSSFSRRSTPALPWTAAMEER
jgi:hypothetical protein